MTHKIVRRADTHDQRMQMAGRAAIESLNDCARAACRLGLELEEITEARGAVPIEIDDEDSMVSQVDIAIVALAGGTK